MKLALGARAVVRLQPRVPEAQMRLALSFAKALLPPRPVDADMR